MIRHCASMGVSVSLALAGAATTILSKCRARYLSAEFENQPLYWRASAHAIAE